MGRYVPLGILVPVRRYDGAADPARTVKGGRMKPDREEAAGEVERLTRLRDEAEKGSAEHRELNHLLMKARRRLLHLGWPKTDRR